MRYLARLLRRTHQEPLWRTLVIVVLVLLSSRYMGARASRRWLSWLVAGTGGLVLLLRPVWGLPALTVVALIVPREIATGTDVKLNVATLLIAALTGFWLLDMLVRQRELRFASARSNRPLLLFLGAALLSLAIGNVLWDPTVPRSGTFILVQLAQWALFALSACAYWLTANLVEDQVWLRRLTWTFLVVGGSAAILWVIPGVHERMLHVATDALMRAPFRMVLSALIGGQLLFNRDLGWRKGLFFLCVLAAVFFYSFIWLRDVASNWVGVTVVACVLLWLRFPRLRWPVVGLFAILSIAGRLIPAVYEFAGGDAEWNLSGGARIVLIGRVMEVSMRNPITGLGPASYRRYAALEPLPYREALWWSPRVSSHNNYVDLFSQTGLLGLGLFAWFAIEVTLLGIRLRKQYTEGFAAGYVNGMLATWAGAVVIMMLGDWILPFVYNIGFPGFQASVLLWLFWGGLVALERMATSAYGSQPQSKD